VCLACDVTAPADYQQMSTVPRRSTRSRRERFLRLRRRN